MIAGGTFVLVSALFAERRMLLPTVLADKQMQPRKVFP